MTERNTIARPYAKAAFQHALDTDAIPAWSEALACLAAIVDDPLSNLFLDNPSVDSETQIECLFSVLNALLKKKKTDKALVAFVQVLSDNKRLPFLPDVYTLFDAFRAAHDKTIDVNVATVMPLSKQEREQFADALSRRLKRKVSLDVTENPDLLGGVVVQAGDLVIDGSVRGKLNQLTRWVGNAAELTPV